jgi:GMC oxidoreductase
MINATLEGASATLHETIIIGSGPAGLTLAMELARLGRPSLVLESGVVAPGAAQDLSGADIADPSRHDSMSIAVARRLGGTSNLWGGRCLPLDRSDFEPRAFARGARWPISYEDIAPFYEIACRYANCGEAIFEYPLPGGQGVSDDFAMSTIERASNQPRFQRAHAAALAASKLIDIRLGATVVGFTLGENSRVSCVTVAGADGRRSQMRGERLVIAAGGLESTRLLLALQRGHAGLFGGADGPLGRFYMGHIIGEVADIVFANERLDAAFDFQLDGRGSYVRRRFTPSPRLQRELSLPNISFWPVVPPVADARHASGPLSAVAMALSTPVLARALVPELIRARHVSDRINWAAHTRNVIADVPSTLGFLGGFIHKRYLSRYRIPGYFLRNRARRYGLSYHSEQSPNPESRVSLSQSRDRLGLPRLNIDLRYSRDDAEGVARAHEHLARWLESSGFGRIEYRQAEGCNVEAVVERMAHGSHQIGTARMGRTRGDGIVDGDLRCFDCPNLYVASSAIFPTSGQANPTLSIVAFAARLAARLARETSAATPVLMRAQAYA